MKDDTVPKAPLYPCGVPLRDLAEPLRLAVLGATGSIGRQTLDLVRRHPDRLQVAAVTCHGRLDDLRALLAELAQGQPEVPPPLVAITSETAHTEARGTGEFTGRLLPPGPDGLISAVNAPADLDCVVNGLVGAVGLAPTLAAADRGLRIALANKESLVVGGDLVRRAVAAGGAEVLPVDSEHSAIAQALSGRRPQEIGRLILTASGGPFRETDAAHLQQVTLDEVLNHPTWNMGPKITVDSATLMNKGLEVIEAHVLFGLPYDRIEVVVHPGSYVHSCVEFVDGAILAQLGMPDMRVPLQYAINGERHWPLPTARLDLVKLGTLHFEAPDLQRFPCLDLARRAGRAGGSGPIVLNAANEVAVAALLERRLRYVDIAPVIAESLAEAPSGSIDSLETALAVDTNARRCAAEIVARLADTR